MVYISLTFWPFKQVDFQNRLGWGLPPSNQQPHHWACLLQGLHRPAVNHLRHIHVIHTQHAVIYPVEGKVLTYTLYFHLHASLSVNRQQRWSYFAAQRQEETLAWPM